MQDDAILAAKSAMEHPIAGEEEKGYWGFRVEIGEGRGGWP